jgi:hypothetical protein
MQRELVPVIQIILGVGAGVFTIAAAFCKFMSTVEDKKHDKTQQWFAKRWQELDNSSVWRLPDLAAGWHVLLLFSLGKRFGKLAGRHNPWLVLVIIPCLVITLILILIRWPWLVLGTILSAALLLLSAVVVVAARHRIFKDVPASYTHAPLLLKVLRVIAVLLCVGTTHVLLDLIRVSRHIGTGAAALGSPVLLPVWLSLIAWVYLALVFLPTGFPPAGRTVERLRRRIPTLLSYSMLLPFSFIFSYVAIAIGHYIEPHEWIPISLQMFLANGVCDLLTIIAINVLLPKALQAQSSFRIPLVFCTHVAIGAILAMLAVYSGLAFTQRAISWSDAWNILWAQSDGTSVELGPLFWLAHTTFIPTVAFLSVVLLAWLGKMVVLPIERFFRAGMVHSDPMVLTAELFGLIALLFATPLSIIALVVS